MALRAPRGLLDAAPTDLGCTAPEAEGLSVLKGAKAELVNWLLVPGFLSLERGPQNTAQAPVLERLKSAAADLT